MKNLILCRLLDTNFINTYFIADKIVPDAIALSAGNPQQVLIKFHIQLVVQLCWMLYNYYENLIRILKCGF